MTTLLRKPYKFLVKLHNITGGNKLRAPLNVLYYPYIISTILYYPMLLILCYYYHTSI
jgi:hypothetical protein